VGSLTSIHSFSAASVEKRAASFPKALPPKRLDFAVGLLRAVGVDLTPPPVQGSDRVHRTDLGYRV